MTPTLPMVSARTWRNTPEREEGGERGSGGGVGREEMRWGEREWGGRK